MGKGDIKTKKGKRAAGSSGVTRKRKKTKNTIDTKPKAIKKTPAKKKVVTEEKKTTAKKATSKKAPAKTATKKTTAKKATTAKK